MRNASGHQGKMNSSEKKFTGPHFVVVQNNGKEMYKKCASRASLFCLLIRPIVFFFAVFVAVAAWLALHDFTFCFSKL